MPRTSSDIITERVRIDDHFKAAVCKYGDRIWVHLNTSRQDGAEWKSITLTPKQLTRLAKKEPEIKKVVKKLSEKVKKKKPMKKSNKKARTEEPLSLSDQSSAAGEESDSDNSTDDA